MENKTILDLRNEKYNLANGYLYFDTITGNKVIIDKKLALEITHTLLDSLNLLDKDTEKLLYEIEERIENDE